MVAHRHVQVGLAEISEIRTVIVGRELGREQRRAQSAEEPGSVWFGSCFRAGPGSAECFPRALLTPSDRDLCHAAAASVESRLSQNVLLSLSYHPPTLVLLWHSRVHWCVILRVIAWNISFKTEKLQTLTDLNDFITPSQACIKPVEQTNKPEPHDPGAAFVSIPLYKFPFHIIIVLYALR